nr:metallophosphoesterase [uncultured Pedobacter sp.]
MRIAFISDIHGNLPVLETVLSDIELQEINTVFCLEDLVDSAPWPDGFIKTLWTN